MDDKIAILYILVANEDDKGMSYMSMVQNDIPYILGRPYSRTVFACSQAKHFACEQKARCIAYEPSRD